jgi:hypothetical protein
MFKKPWKLFEIFVSFYKFNYIVVLKTYDSVVCCSILYGSFFLYCISAERGMLII